MQRVFPTVRLGGTEFKALTKSIEKTSIHKLLPVIQVLSPRNSVSWPHLLELGKNPNCDGQIGQQGFGVFLWHKIGNAARKTDWTVVDRWCAITLFLNRGMTMAIFYCSGITQLLKQNWKKNEC